MREMKVTTFEGHQFTIRFDRRSNGPCYSCMFPDYMDAEPFLKHDDYILRGENVYFSGSLTRMLSVIAEFIGRTEL